MRARRKEHTSTFSDMDAEFALRAKMKALRMKHEAPEEKDAWGLFVTFRNIWAWILLFPNFSFHYCDK